MLKNNAELWTKLKKTTWKAFQKLLNEAPHMSISARLVTDYYYYYHHHRHHRISHFSALVGKYSPILGRSNQHD